MALIYKFTVTKLLSLEESIFPISAINILLLGNGIFFDFLWRLITISKRWGLLKINA